MAHDRFTTLAQEALAGAQSTATRSGHAQITPLHLLSSLLEARDAVAGSILDRAGIDRDRVRQVAEAAADCDADPTCGGFQFSPHWGGNVRPQFIEWGASCSHNSDWTSYRKQDCGGNPNRPATGTALEVPSRPRRSAPPSRRAPGTRTTGPRTRSSTSARR